VNEGSGKPALRYGTAWALVAAALLGFYVGRNILAASARVGRGPSDFGHYHEAARATLEGRSPYSVRGFLYPPPALLPVLPLASLDEVTARRWWFWASELLVLGSAFLMWRRLGGGATAALAVAFVWSFTGTVAENLVLGQINPVLLMLLTAAMIAPAAAASRSAIWVGVAGALKIWPGALLVEPLVQRRWRACVTGGAVAVALVAGTTAALVVLRPPPSHPQAAGSWAGSPAFLNLSLPATALRLADAPVDWSEMPRSWLTGNRLEDVEVSPQAAAVSLATALSVFGGGLFLMFRRVRPGTSPLPVYAALIALTLAAAPVSWYHYRLLHLPGLAWLTLALMSRRDHRGLALLASLVVVVTWSHLAWMAPVGVAVEPWFVLARGFLVPVFELVLAAWYLRAATDADDTADLHEPGTQN
jgi:hypothetical protein